MLDRVGRQAAAENVDELIHVPVSDRLPKAQLVTAFLQRPLKASSQVTTLTPTVRWSESESEVSASWSQPRRQVEHVSRPEEEIVNGLARAAHLGRVLLVAQRELERWLVDQPALLAGHPQHEDAWVRGGLEGLARRAACSTRSPEPDAPACARASGRRRELGPMQMQALKDNRRAALPLVEHAVDVGRAGETARAPRDFCGVVANGELLARLDEPESREAQPARRDEALDFDSERRSS